MTLSSSSSYPSRGGEKLAFALDRFDLSVAGRVCADLGSHVGGFVDCLLRRGASRVYSVDTAYGTLAWTLRQDPRVVVFERTNAMHVSLPERVDFVTIDVGWTRQSKILPNVSRLVTPKAKVLSLIKPHYEAPKPLLREGVLPDGEVESVVSGVLREIESLGWTILDTTHSPIRGRGGNQEVFVLLSPGHTVQTAKY